MVVGALVAVIALPGTALAGLLASRGADAYADLPANLQTPALAQTTRLYASDGKTLITTFSDENRSSVKLADVAPVMRQAIVAAEDTRFYEHTASTSRACCVPWSPTAAVAGSSRAPRR